MMMSCSNKKMFLAVLVDSLNAYFVDQETEWEIPSSFDTFQPDMNVSNSDFYVVDDS